MSGSTPSCRRSGATSSNDSGGNPMSETGVAIGARSFPRYGARRSTPDKRNSLHRNRERSRRHRRAERLRSQRELEARRGAPRRRSRGRVHHLLKGSDSGDGVLGERKCVGDGSDELPVHVDRTSAHARDDAGVRERAAFELREDHVLVRAVIPEHAEDDDLEGLDASRRRRRFVPRRPCPGESGRRESSRARARRARERARRIAGTARRLFNVVFPSMEAPGSDGVGSGHFLWNSRVMIIQRLQPVNERHDFAAFLTGDGGLATLRAP